MADKKISALTQVADADIGADDLLHIVDNPGGTPVNKKMTIGQIFENIPTHLAVDDIAVVTTSASNLASTFATDFNLAGASGNITPTLDNGTDTGQLKVMYASTAGNTATVAITNAASSDFNQIVFNAIGETAILYWNGSKWFILASTGATIS
tara:strand:+ start:264 stop:722 length:459 start_codon:yes stop_codon:yes gene_type:complete